VSLYNGITLPNAPDLENIRRLDLMILPQLNRMSRYGIAIDVPYLQELGSQFAAEIVSLQRDIASYIPTDALDRFSAAAASVEELEGSAQINAGSAEQIRTLLFDLLDVGRDQKLKTTGTGAI
jgi:DNA polymerase I-like protein with 3'-5' exonuclease and polymerase domains